MMTMLETPGRPLSRTAGTHARRLQRSERRVGLGLVTPTAALFAAFVGWPILFTLYLSFTSWSGFGSPQLSGAANYQRMVGDPVARGAILLTIIYAIVTTLLQTFIPLVVATLVNNVWRTFSIVIRSILFVPVLVSFVASGVLWQLIYDPNVGVLNRTLKAIGLSALAQPWLASGTTAVPAIMVVSLWGALGVNMLILLAGLQGVDPVLYEAARVDGASRLQQFRYITVPSLRVITAIVLSLNLMNGFKVFDLIYVMTGGGPNHASEVLGTYLYEVGFGYGASTPQLGYASAFSVVTMVLCIVAVLMQIWLSKRAER
jgi:ABC-type sugar transport system permease subunit